MATCRVCGKNEWNISPNGKTATCNGCKTVRNLPSGSSTNKRSKKDPVGDIYKKLEDLGY
jgi:hypothetical protein